MDPLYTHSYIAHKAIVFMLHILMRLAFGDVVEVLATVFVAKELVRAMQLLVLLQLLSAHEGHRTYVALEFILLYDTAALGHMTQIDLLLEEDLFAALTNRQTLRRSLSLQLTARIAKRVL